MPIESKIENPKTLIRLRTTKNIRQRLAGSASGMHRCQAGDTDRVEPWPDIRWENLITRHAAVRVPEVSERFGVLDLLPVKTLESFDNGEVGPVDGLDVPDGDGTHDTA